MPFEFDPILHNKAQKIFAPSTLETLRGISIEDTHDLTRDTRTQLASFFSKEVSLILPEGISIGNIQTQLKKKLFLNDDFTIDARYGLKTYLALKEYQKISWLTPTWFPDTQTLERLLSVMHKPFDFTDNHFVQAFSRSRPTQFNDDFNISQWRLLWKLEQNKLTQKYQEVIWKKWKVMMGIIGALCDTFMIELWDDARETDFYNYWLTYSIKVQNFLSTLAISEKDAPALLQDIDAFLNQVIEELSRSNSTIIEKRKEKIQQFFAKNMWAIREGDEHMIDTFALEVLKSPVVLHHHLIKQMQFSVSGVESANLEKFFSKVPVKVPQGTKLQVMLFGKTFPILHEKPQELLQLFQDQSFQHLGRVDIDFINSKIIDYFLQAEYTQKDLQTHFSGQKEVLQLLEHYYMIFPDSFKEKKRERSKLLVLIFWELKKVQTPQEQRRDHYITSKKEEWPASALDEGTLLTSGKKAAVGMYMDVIGQLLLNFQGIPENDIEPQNDTPINVMIPWLGCNAWVMKHIWATVREKGYGDVYYAQVSSEKGLDNGVSIEKTATEIVKQLKVLHQQYPHKKLKFVTHSMWAPIWLKVLEILDKQFPELREKVTDFIAMAPVITRVPAASICEGIISACADLAKPGDYILPTPELLWKTHFTVHGAIRDNLVPKDYTMIDPKNAFLNDTDHIGFLLSQKHVYEAFRRHYKRIN
jgi:hypothetical protein